MPGQRAVESATFITSRNEHRTNVAAVDTDVTSDAIPLLDTRVNLQSVGVGNMYGATGKINLAVLLSGSTVTLELWLHAILEMAAPGLPGPTTLNPVPATGEWIFVDTLTTNISRLWTIENLAPGHYKVLVTALSGGGKVSIREQHAH